MHPGLVFLVARLGGPLTLDPSAFLADPELILALDTRSIAISCGEEYVLFRQGDAPAGLFILHKGEATMTMTSAAGESIISIQTKAGSLLGLPALIGNEPYTLTAVARQGSELGFIARDEFTALMRSEPMVSLKILQVLAAEVRAARHALLSI